MTDNSHKPVDSSDGKARPTTVPDPNRKYVPSGRSTSKTLQTYLWFSIIAIFAIQLPVYVTSFLSISIIPIVFSMSGHINMNRGLGLSIVVWSIFAFLVGYFFTGLMLGKFIRIGTERSHCRNRRMEVLAIIGTLVAAFCLKVCIVYYISKTHTKAQNVNVFDLPIRFWVEMVFSWGIIALGSLVKKMRPYCEECENYMVKKQYNFMPSELDSLLSGISSCDLELLRKCKRTDSHYPSVELQIHTCDNLHSGYIEVSLNTETADEKGSKSKSSKTVYSDHMSSGAVGVWCRAMGQAPINVASRPELNKQPIAETRGNHATIKTVKEWIVSNRTPFALAVAVIVAALVAFAFKPRDRFYMVTNTNGCTYRIDKATGKTWLITPSRMVEVEQVEKPTTQTPVSKDPVQKNVPSFTAFDDVDVSDITPVSDPFAGFEGVERIEAADDPFAGFEGVKRDAATPPAEPKKTLKALPLDEIAKLEGKAGVSGSRDSISGQIYNGSSWDVSELTVSVTGKAFDGNKIWTRKFKVGFYAPSPVAPLSVGKFMFEIGDYFMKYDASTPFVDNNWAYNRANKLNDFDWNIEDAHGLPTE